MMLPLTINKRLSNWLKISEEGWWMVLTTFLPCIASFFKTSSTWRAVVESRPVVGSSRKIKLGLVMSSTPMEVLFLSPPDKPLMKVLPTLVSAHFWRPSSWIKLSTLCFFSSLLNFNLRFAVKLKTSRGVMVAMRISSCWTKATRFPINSISVMGFELILRSPLMLRRDSVLPERTLSRVVFPHPKNGQKDLLPWCTWRSHNSSELSVFNASTDVV